MRRIYFAVFGSGLGHVTRVLDIAGRVRRNGDEFRYSCSLQALDYLNTRLDKGSILESPALDVEWTEGGSFSSKDFIPHFPYIKMIILSQVLNGVLLPFVLYFMLRLINNKELMGKHTNSRWFNVIAWATTVIVVGLSVVMMWQQIHGGS